MNNQEKGLLYEKYVKDFIIQKLGKNAYLWNECPENILIENNLIHSHNTMRLIRKDIKEGHLHNHKDIGIDIIQIENDECSIVQCKNGYNNGLCVDDISGIMMRCAFIRDVNTFIYYTECLSRNIRYTSEISPYVISIDCSNQTDKLLGISNDNKIYFIKLPYENNNEVIQDIKIDITPYSYQIEAINKFKEHYQSNNRGILSLPCGCGKTYTSYLISNDYKHIVILSPLREFASQNLNRFIEYGYDKNNTLLVDTDGNRDINSIKKFITEHNNLIISCTYNSMDLISESLDLFKDALFIIDEFHNLSKANISDSENNIFKLLTSDHRILFMSATPRIYDIEYDDNESYEMECLFGDVVYKMTFTDAIANEYITDYKIWLPSIHENNEELDKELSIYDIDNQIKNRCKFLYSCIANNASRKCIIYCKDTEDMKAMMECMKTLNEFYIMDVDMNSISCEDNEKKRKSVLECFTKNNDKIQLLFNIRILNECIDIPVCDSIYISYAPKNKITTIQRISRATRSDKNNPYKIANAYIWCEAYEEILETLSSIKEYDIMFKDKIKVNAVDFYHSKEDKEIELVENDKVLLSNCIVGVKEFRVYSWEEKLKMVEEYIKEQNKIPSTRDSKKHTKTLGYFIANALNNYRYRKHKMNIESNYIIFTKFIEKYKEYFIDNDEIWYDYLQKVKTYIDNHQKRPSKNDSTSDISKLAVWINTQKSCYKRNIKAFKNEKINSEWKTFMKEYIQYFTTEEDKWKDKLNEVKDYIIENNKLPSASDKNQIVLKLGRWISTQKKLYNKTEKIMKNENLRKIWKEFVEDNSTLFYTNEEVWYYNYNKLKSYIDINNKLPPISDEKEEIRSLCLWMRTQKANYVKNEFNMKNENIKNVWEQFINQYAELFMSNKDIWHNKFNTIVDYIEKNSILPSRSSLDFENKNMAKWIQDQKKHYKNKTGVMNLLDIRQIWEDFINKYDKYKTNTDKWFENFEAVQEYVKQNKQLPSKEKNKDKNIQRLGNWVNSQKQNHKNKTQILKDETVFKLFDEFVKENYDLFKTNEELWMDNYNLVCEYVKAHNILPSDNVLNNFNKSLGNWVSKQKQAYKIKEDIMKNEEFRKIWEQFVETNHVLFKSNEDIWYDKLNQLKIYIQNHQKLPSNSDKDRNIKALAQWTQKQKENFQSHKQIMSFENIRKEWLQFLSHHYMLFMSREELWRYKLKNLSEYIQTHNKLPSIRDDDNNTKMLAHFMYSQRQTYKTSTKIMQDPIIRKEWEDFTYIYSVYNK